MVIYLIVLLKFIMFIFKMILDIKLILYFNIIKYLFKNLKIDINNNLNFSSFIKT